MDLTSLMSSMLSDSNVNSVSGKTGISTDQVASVMAVALPILLNGANKQAESADTSESFHEAVLEHAEKNPEKVDAEEGQKIVAHLLGDETEEIEKAVAKKSGLSKLQVVAILAALAPIVMNGLGQHTTQSNSSNAGTTATLLSSLLGGNSGSTASNALMTAALGAVLSGALGSGSSQSNAGTSILGSVLGSTLSSNNSQSAASSVLGSLLGGSQSAQSQSSTASLLGSLLGGSQSTQSQSSSSLAGSLLGSMLDTNPVQEEQASSSGSSGLLSGLLGLLK